MTTCKLELERAGKPYPRTCSACGLGACLKGLDRPVAPAAAAGPDGAAPVHYWEKEYAGKPLYEHAAVERYGFDIGPWSASIKPRPNGFWVKFDDHLLALHKAMQAMARANVRHYGDMPLEQQDALAQQGVRMLIHETARKHGLEMLRVKPGISGGVYLSVPVRLAGPATRAGADEEPKPGSVLHVHLFLDVYRSHPEGGFTVIGRCLDQIEHVYIR